MLRAFSAADWSGSPLLGRVIVCWESLRQDQLNARDMDFQRRGYYEELDMARANYRVWKELNEKPAGWTNADLFRIRDDFLRRENLPSCSGILGGTLATMNRWGMRDHEYEKESLPAFTVLCCWVHLMKLVLE